MSLQFSRRLIKGRIAELVFEQMIREEEQYTVIPFGYEHTVPTLAQYQDLVKVRHIMSNISDTPDFVLISNDKTMVYLVEVKYQRRLNIITLRKEAKDLLTRWPDCWLFLVTPEGFYCSTCRTIAEETRINPLSEKWVRKGRQIKYLELLNEFENKI